MAAVERLKKFKVLIPSDFWDMPNTYKDLERLEQMLEYRMTAPSKDVAHQARTMPNDILHQAMTRNAPIAVINLLLDKKATPISAYANSFAYLYTWKYLQCRDTPEFSDLLKRLTNLGDRPNTEALNYYIEFADAPDPKVVDGFFNSGVVPDQHTLRHTLAKDSTECAAKVIRLVLNMRIFDPKQRPTGLRHIKKTDLWVPVFPVSSSPAKPGKSYDGGDQKEKAK